MGKWLQKSELVSPGVLDDMGAGRGFMPGPVCAGGPSGRHFKEFRGKIAALLLVAIVLQPGMGPGLVCCDAGCVVPVQQPLH